MTMSKKMTIIKATTKTTKVKKTRPCLPLTYMTVSLDHLRPPYLS
jgi:hypothetical protein